MNGLLAYTYFGKRILVLVSHIALALSVHGHAVMPVRVPKPLQRLKMWTGSSVLACTALHICVMPSFIHERHVFACII